MLQTLFYPDGRIGPVAFRNAALALIAAGAAVSLTPVAVPALWMVSFAGFLFLYPWVVIWVKRFHDAGKSGWWFLAVFVPWLVTGAIANHFITAEFGLAPPQPGTPVDIWGYMAAQTQAIALPATIASVVISLVFALVVNEELKSDPGENRHGSPPARQ
ncbi:MAG TPA: DUF805 domain-containing protein [Rhizomicrobium sp.]|nr:DUF805 domain-containing protein [Rhizomicrobium sp.]